MARYPDERGTEGRGRQGNPAGAGGRDDRQARDAQELRREFGDGEAWRREGQPAAERGFRGKHEDSHFGRVPGDYREPDRSRSAFPESEARAYGGRSEEDGQARRGRGSYDADYYYPDDARERRVRDRDYYDVGRNEERTMTFDRASGEVSAWLDGRDRIERRQADARYRGRGPKNYVRSDDRIREDINDRLSDDPDIDASDIEVTVASGEVTLDGTVSERFAKRHAEDIAETVSGVKHVQNNLRIGEASS